MAVIYIISLNLAVGGQLCLSVQKLKNYVRNCCNVV